METYYIRKKDRDTVEVEDEDSLMIIDTDDSTVTRLNGTGSQCWALLKERQSSESLARSLITEQKQVTGDNELSRLSSDIQIFLDEMVHCGLIENEG